eukprot:CAMPEP_0183379466 /NCGR_PEP_ID=MMETSP0164_2-20130417/125437_1 /TAXON_ID=221442 /ORGANISM="Coccolithus pelagicus ssp braarudi, Strain PLY182g" /LENGTH=166 /DNA_ID=CAMNT_0025557049 /DNA_START=18 /DNA_END=518 /DNA_ORIENTATION=+
MSRTRQECPMPRLVEREGGSWQGEDEMDKYGPPKLRGATNARLKAMFEEAAPGLCAHNHTHAPRVGSAVLAARIVRAWQRPASPSLDRPGTVPQAAATTPDHAYSTPDAKASCAADKERVLGVAGGLKNNPFPVRDSGSTKSKAKGPKFVSPLASPRGVDEVATDW